MLDITIKSWNDVTKQLNGYVLTDVIIDKNLIIGINSNGEKFNLAKRTPAYWEALDGYGYITLSNLLDSINSDILKPQKIYDRESKDKTVVEELKKIILLMKKNYK